MSKQVAKKKSASGQGRNAGADDESVHSADYIDQLRAVAKSVREGRAAKKADDATDVDNEPIPDEVQRRRQQCRAEAEKAQAEGRNVVDECGVICDLDTLTVPQLKAKLTHPEYAPDNRGGKPRALVLALLAEREPKLAAEVEAMSAKDYVRYLTEDFSNPDAAHNEDVFGKDELLKALEKMNRDIAVIKIGNAVKYLVPGVGADGRSEYRFLSGHDFHQLYANVRVPGGAVYDAGLATLHKRDGWQLSVLWDRWSGRRELEGIGFFPGSPKHKARAPHGYLNMWSGLAIEPTPGDWSLFKSHLRGKVCGGDDGHFDFLMDWLAHAVQHPQEKPGSAIVLKSSQKGSGKSMLLKFLRSIFGRHLYSAAKSDQLTGRFNGHLEETLIFGVEEGFWAGNPAANSALKDLITGEHIAIERKGIDSRNVPNFTRFIFLSNENWVVPVGTDERRYFVLEFENDRAKDRAYFDPIFEQMEQRDGIAAMLHELMNREITSNLRNPPATAGLLKQRAQTLDGVDRFLLELATEGEIVSHGSENAHRLKLGGLPIGVPKRVVFELASKFTDRYEGRSLQVALGAKLAALGVRSRDTGRGDDRKIYEFASLHEFRASVERVLGLPIEASEGEETEDEAMAREWGHDRHRSKVSIKLHKVKKPEQRRAVH